MFNLMIQLYSQRRMSAPIGVNKIVIIYVFLIALGLMMKLTTRTDPII